MQAGQALRAQFLPLYVPGLLFSTAWAGLQLAVPLYALGHGASAAQTGVILALFELGSLVAGAPGGALVARLSPRLGSVLGAMLLGLLIAVASLLSSVTVSKPVSSVASSMKNCEAKRIAAKRMRL